MTRPERVTVGVIGCGRLAWSLAPALAGAGYRVTAVAGRDAVAAAALAAAIAPGVEATTAPQRALDVADLVVLAVPDGVIAPLAAGLRWQARHLAVHCSGAVGLEALAPVLRAGGHAGGLHPLQSFPARRAQPERFRGIACGVEGAEPLGGLLERLAGDLGARPFRLDGVDRAAYHAAAVFASNDVVALVSAAQRAWTLAGLPAATARAALAPLLVAAAENVAQLEAGAELGAALTGPLARGDVASVEAHLAALSAAPDLRELYRLLARQLLAVAPHLNADARRELERRLAPPRAPGTD